MLIKITKSCANGCSHCMNDSKSCNEHMTKETFIDVLNFCLKYDNNPTGNIITGGEPTEHPNFIEFINLYYEIFPKTSFLTVATNGHWIAEHQLEVSELLDKYIFLAFQVTYDTRYYPKKLDTTKRIFRNKRVILIDEVENIYPQGRAVINKITPSPKYSYSKCINITLITAQAFKYGLAEIISLLRKANKLCTPTINYDGGIGFGESDLCLVQCSIYNDEKTILEKMLFNECKKCPFTEPSLQVVSTIAYGREQWKGENNAEN